MLTQEEVHALIQVGGLLYDLKKDDRIPQEIRDLASRWIENGYPTILRIEELHGDRKTVVQTRDIAERLAKDSQALWVASDHSCDMGPDEGQSRYIVNYVAKCEQCLIQFLDYALNVEGDKNGSRA